MVVSLGNCICYGMLGGRGSVASEESVDETSKEEVQLTVLSPSERAHGWATS